MDKKSVVGEYSLLLQQLLASQEATLKETESIVRDAPGSNVTRSDTSRFQYGNQHLGQQMLVDATREYVASLREAERKCDSVRTGALVCLEDEQGFSSWYLVLQKANAQVVKSSEQNVTVISIEAPLARSLIGKAIDDEVEFRGNIFVLTDIQ